VVRAEPSECTSLQLSLFYFTPFSLVNVALSGATMPGEVFLKDIQGTAI
jgi:hypothetical protein